MLCGREQVPWTLTWLAALELLCQVVVALTKPAATFEGVHSVNIGIYHHDCIGHSCFVLELMASSNLESGSNCCFTQSFTLMPAAICQLSADDGFKHCCLHTLLC